MEYGTHVENILKRWGKEAKTVGNSYLKLNITGLNEMSVNAHKLNSLISTLSSEGAVHNVDLLKALAVTSARIVRYYEELQNKAAEIEKAKNNKKSEKTDASK